MAKYAILSQKFSFCPFQSLALRGEKDLTFQTSLRKSLILSSVDQSATLAWKITFRGEYDQIYDFGLKIVIFGHFHSLPMWGKKILTFQTWLRKSLVLPSWGHGAEVSWKKYLAVSRLSNVRLWLQYGHFGPFQTLSPRGKKISTFQTWLKKSLVLPSRGQGAKLAWKILFSGVNVVKCAILA